MLAITECENERFFYSGMIQISANDWNFRFLIVITFLLRYSN